MTTPLGTLLRARREELGYTQEEVVERMHAQGDNIGQSELSKIEVGTIKMPRSGRLLALLNVLQLTPGEVFEQIGFLGARNHLTDPNDLAASSLPKELVRPSLELLTLLPKLPPRQVTLLLELTRLLSKRVES